jgi:hypothetical protein
MPQEKMGPISGHEMDGEFLRFVALTGFKID